MYDVLDNVSTLNLSSKVVLLSTAINLSSIDPHDFCPPKHIFTNRLSTKLTCAQI